MSSPLSDTLEHRLLILAPVGRDASLVEAMLRKINVACHACPTLEDLATELERGICAIDPRVARAFATASFYCDLRAQLPLCQQPVLVVQCQHDDIVPNAAAEYLARHLPRSRYKLLPASGHCPQLTHPAELRRIISDFLES